MEHLFNMLQSSLYFSLKNNNPALQNNITVLQSFLKYDVEDINYLWVKEFLVVYGVRTPYTTRKNTTRQQPTTRHAKAVSEMSS